MSFDTFKQNADPDFVDPVLISFNYLENEYGLKVSGMAAGPETVISYEDESIRINVIYTIDQSPFVNIQRIEGNRIKKEYRYKPNNEDVICAIREYENSRDITPLEEWFEQIQRGAYAELLRNIVEGLARDIKPVLDRVIRTGDFEDI